MKYTEEAVHYIISMNSRLRFSSTCFQLNTPVLQRSCITWRGRNYSALCRRAEALDLFEQTLAFQRRMLPADHPDIGSSLLKVGFALFCFVSFSMRFQFVWQAVGLAPSANKDCFSTNHRNTATNKHSRLPIFSVDLLNFVCCIYAGQCGFNATWISTANANYAQPIQQGKPFTTLLAKNTLATCTPAAAVLAAGEQPLEDSPRGPSQCTAQLRRAMQAPVTVASSDTTMSNAMRAADCDNIMVFPASDIFVHVEAS